MKAAEPAFVVPSGQRQLFLDDHAIATMEHLKRSLHKPHKMGAVIRPNVAAGEESIQTRSGAAWDDEAKVFKLWLISPSCYESRDGLHWSKPMPQPTVAVISAVIDPDDPDRQRRYKGLVSVGGGREPVVSPDGIGWSRLKVPPIPSQDESNLSYDRTTRTFIATVKHRGPYGRTVWLSTSKNFENWTKPELIFFPDEQDQTLARATIKDRLANRTLQPMQFNDVKTYNVQVYNMGLFRYEGLYLGMPAMFHSTGPVPDYPNTDGFHVIELVCSRDLKTWKRLGDRKAFIGPSPVGGGAYDLTQILPPSFPVVRGDELWFYYTGLKYRSAGSKFVGKYPGGQWIRRPGADKDQGAICLAVLRRDGFLSLDAGDKPGTLVTKSFPSPGGRLFVNVDAPDGELRVELLAGGKVVAGSTPLTGDHPRGEIRWQTSSFADSNGQAVSLRFTLRQASFYSFWLSATGG